MNSEKFSKLKLLLESEKSWKYPASPELKHCENSMLKIMDPKVRARETKKNAFENPGKTESTNLRMRLIHTKLNLHTKSAVPDLCYLNCYNIIYIFINRKNTWNVLYFFFIILLLKSITPLNDCLQLFAIACLKINLSNSELNKDSSLFLVLYNLNGIIRRVLGIVQGVPESVRDGTGSSGKHEKYRFLYLLHISGPCK